MRLRHVGNGRINLLITCSVLTGGRWCVYARARICVCVCVLAQVFSFMFELGGLVGGNTNNRHASQLREERRQQVINGATRNDSTSLDHSSFTAQLMNSYSGSDYF